MIVTFRASRADRQEVIEVLKAAFVQGRLTGMNWLARRWTRGTHGKPRELAKVTAPTSPAELSRSPGLRA